MKPSKLVLLCLLFLNITPYAQGVDIIPYLKEIEGGSEDAVRKSLDELIKNFPEDPDVKFLDAVLTIDGQEALEKYLTLYTKFPNSTFADAALYRIFSYYYALGFYRKAEDFLTKLKTEYPNSPYIKTADRQLPDDDEIVLEEAAPEQTEKEIKPEFNFTVQAGAFLNYENAKRLKNQFEESGMYSEIFTKEVGGSLLNVVIVGKFSSEDQAIPLLEILDKNYKLQGRIIPLNN